MPNGQANLTEMHDDLKRLRRARRWLSKVEHGCDGEAYRADRCVLSAIRILRAAILAEVDLRLATPAQPTTEGER